LFLFKEDKDLKFRKENKDSIFRNENKDLIFRNASVTVPAADYLP
jgi:hypothetical protein